LLLGVLALVAPAQAAPPLDSAVLCYENENVRPWRTKAGTGFNFEVLDDVAAKLKLRFRFEGVPWKRCLFELKNNRYVGAIGASFKPERMEYGIYPGGNPPDSSKALYVERYVVVRRKGAAVNWDGKRFEQLNRAAGAPLGYSVVDDLRHSGITVDDGARTAVDVLQKLLFERIDVAVLLQGEMGALLAEDAGLREKLEILPKPFVEKPYFLLLSHQLVKTRPELAEQIWSGIRRVRSNAAYQEKERQALGIIR
jgi:polar amino acid transport system substrate-binding protein